MRKSTPRAMSRMRGIVGHSYDPAASRWLDVLRRYAYETDHIITKLEPNAFWLAPEYLKQAREEVGLSQRALAAAAGISSGVVANWEAGAKDAGWENVVRLYDVLETRGSESATKAKLSIALTDKEISRTTLRLIEGDRDAVKARLAKCEAEEQRLRAKLDR